MDRFNGLLLWSAISSNSVINQELIYKYKKILKKEQRKNLPQFIQHESP